MILSLDPSSTCTGYALLKGTGAGDLIEAGKLTPGKTRDAAIYRILAMERDLSELIREKQPSTIVIEISSGHVGKRHGGGGAGLAIYGMAVGALWRVCRELVNNVQAIEENLWTRGIPKSKRQSTIAMFYGTRYNSQNDKNGDVADAIGVGLYHLRATQLRRTDECYHRAGLEAITPVE